MTTATAISKTTTTEMRSPSLNDRAARHCRYVCFSSTSVSVYDRERARSIMAASSTSHSIGLTESRTRDALSPSSVLSMTRRLTSSSSVSLIAWLRGSLVPRVCSSCLDLLQEFDLVHVRAQDLLRTRIGLTRTILKLGVLSCLPSFSSQISYPWHNFSSL